jgi:hypothetical protein
VFFHWLAWYARRRSARNTKIPRYWTTPLLGGT